ncbi:MAG: zinc-dependent metalloprotease [Chloroflexota bacterium]|nr:zinc-dependent metalloprotease [Chloroflexota bacterium]
MATSDPTATSAPTNGNGARSFDKKLLLASAAAAGALAVWANVKGREYSRTGETPSLINWDRARSVALAMNRAADVETFPTSLTDYYRDLVGRCVPLIAEYTGTTLPTPLESVHVFNRADWIDANIRAFQQLFAPLEGLNTARNLTSPTAVALVSGVNQTILSAEVGLLLGYLARRVLGQYDLALLGKEPVATGKLYYVEPNIAAATETMGVDGHEFRLWLALHETTHAFEFEAFPWVRPHFNTLLERYITLVTEDLRNLQGGLSTLIRRLREQGGGGKSLMEIVMTPEQKQLFDEMQALMSVIEGYSNHVMNAVGKQILPSLDAMQRAFEGRQRQRSQAETLFIRLTGLEMKMEQYRLGEQFIDAVVRERDHQFALKVWEGPERLPTLTELRNPKQWIARVERQDAIPAHVQPVAADHHEGA